MKNQQSTITLLIFVVEPAVKTAAGKEPAGKDAKRHALMAEILAKSSKVNLASSTSRCFVSVFLNFIFQHTEYS
jgi:hypothetical protein